MTDDYYRAMSSIEKRLVLLDEEEMRPGPLREDERAQILAIAHQLAKPEISYEARQELVSQICLVVTGSEIVYEVVPTSINNQEILGRPPP